MCIGNWVCLYSTLCVLSICMCILHIVFCTVCKYILSICKFFFFCTVWSTLVRISLTKALVMWWCDNKSDLIWFWFEKANGILNGNHWNFCDGFFWASIVFLAGVLPSRLRYIIIFRLVWQRQKCRELCSFIPCCSLHFFLSLCTNVVCCHSDYFNMIGFQSDLHKNRIWADSLNEAYNNSGSKLIKFKTEVTKCK